MSIFAVVIFQDEGRHDHTLSHVNWLLKSAAGGQEVTNKSTNIKY